MSSPLFRTPALRIHNDLCATQEPTYIETNPFFGLSARLEVLGKRDDDILHQLEFV